MEAAQRIIDVHFFSSAVVAASLEINESMK
jgi:hypothetical protein